MNIKSLFLTTGLLLCLRNANAGVPPTIAVQPVSQQVNAGASVTFSVGASGTQPLAFQWVLDGTNIAGANGSSYFIPDAQLPDDGAYAVIVSNAFGAVGSASALLDVEEPELVLWLTFDENG